MNAWETVMITGRYVLVVVAGAAVMAMSLSLIRLAAKGHNRTERVLLGFAGSAYFLAGLISVLTVALAVVGVL